MGVSTKETASELQKFTSNEGAKILHDWMEAMRLDVLALAAATDVIAGSGTAAVDSITNIEE